MPPTKITFTNGKEVEVAEDANKVASRLNEGHGLPVRFDLGDGDTARVVYVNPQQVTHFEDTLNREPLLASVPR